MADQNDERRKALNLAIAQIEKTCGKGSIMRMGSERARVKVDAISTGAINGTFTSNGLNDPYRIRFYGVPVVGPAIAGITPPTAPVNSPAIQLTIKGTGFSPNPTVRFNNTALTLVSSTSSTIVATVPASFMTSTKTWNVTVSVNGKTSNSTQFRVLPLISPPKLTRVGNYRTGVDQFAGNRYAVLLFQNQGSSDLTNINFSNVRLYVNGTGYVVPFNISIEPGANPAGTLLNTPPGSLLQVRFDFPDFAPPVGSVVRTGTLDVLGTSAQGAFNAGSLFLVFP